MFVFTDYMSGMNGDCISLLRRSYEESSRDLLELYTMDITSRKALLRELESLNGLMRNGCQQNLGNQAFQSAISNFQLSIGKIALSIRNNVDKNNRDPETKRIIGIFNEKEYSAIESLEKFTRLDQLSSDDICTILMNEDDRIYPLIKEWCQENTDDLVGSMADNSDTGIRSSLYAAMDERYKLRLQKINEGVVKYLQKEPGQVRKLFLNYENSMKGIMKMESKRREVERALTEKINSREMGEIMETSIELANLAMERNVDELRKRDIQGSLNSLTRMGNEMDSIIENLREERLELFRDPELKRNRSLMDMEISRIDGLISRADKFIAEKIRRPIAIIEAMRLIGPGNGESGKHGEICNMDTAIIRKTQFFQNESDAFRKMENSSIFIPSYGRHIHFRSRDIKTIADRIKSTISSGDGNISTSLNFRITEQSFLKHDASLEIFLMYHAHDSKLKDEPGIDTRPFDMTDLAEVYGTMLHNSSGEESFMMCLVASPIGFSEEVMKTVENPKGITLSSGNSMIVLVDMKDGSIIYNGNDMYLARAARMICGKESVEDEHYRKIIEVTGQETKTAGIVRKRTIMKQTGMDDDEITSVWKKMEKEGFGKIDTVQGDEVFRQEVEPDLI